MDSRGVSGAIVPGMGALHRFRENLRGYNFAKGEEGGGQTHCVQTVSSPFFNAKSYPLRFSRNLCNAPKPGPTAPDTSQAEKARNFPLFKINGTLFDVDWLEMMA